MRGQNCPTRTNQATIPACPSLKSPMSSLSLSLASVSYAILVMSTLAKMASLSVKYFYETPTCVDQKNCSNASQKRIFIGYEAERIHEPCKEPAHACISAWTISSPSLTTCQHNPPMWARPLSSIMPFALFEACALGCGRVPTKFANASSAT